MKKSFFILILAIASVYASVDDIIISENYIPQKDCKLIKTIKIDDNKNLSKEQIYKKLKQEAKKVDANVLLNIVYHNTSPKNYLSADASICDLNTTTSLNAKVISYTNKNNSKYPKYIYEDSFIEDLSNALSIELGITNSFENTIFAGLSYKTKLDYELYTHIYYIHESNNKDLAYQIGIRQYPFTNTKYENIRLSVNYGTQDYTYINNKIDKQNGINLGLGYIFKKYNKLSMDIFYKAYSSANDNKSFLDHFQLEIVYKF